MRHDTDVLGGRAAALVIDVVLAVLLAVILVFLIPALLMSGPSTLLSSGPGQILSGTAGLLSIVLLVTAVSLPAGLYWFLFEGLWQGKTPGKRLLGLTVVDERGEPISWEKSLIRNVLRPIDMIAGAGVPYLVGLIFVVVTDDHQRLGDMAADTFVVKAR